MKKSLVFSVALSVLSLVLAAGYVQQMRGAGSLLEDVNRLQEEKRALEAERNGLREANADLLGHLERSRRLAVSLPEPVVSPMSIQFTELPPVEEEVFVEVEVFEEPDRELTPEEQAEREQRQAEREARRAEWEARREERRQRTIVQAQERRAFFEQVSTEGLAPEYQVSHQRLLEAMDEVQVRMAALSNPELTRDEQRDMRRELGELGRELNGLMGMQREILLNDYAQAMGFQGEDVRVFIDSIETIQEMTNVGGLMWGGGRGRGGR